MKKGIFITFEGGEGSVKSTHIACAADYLRKKKKKVLVVRDPGSTQISEAIRAILLDSKNQEMAMETELFLYLAARAQFVKEMIMPALQKGMVVISDRFEDSTVVYQGFAGGISPKRIQKIVPEARGNLVPQLTFLLDVSVEEGLRRAGRTDRMEQKSVAFHEKIRRGYLALARKNRKRFMVIATEAPFDKVRKKIEEGLDRAIA